MKNAITDFCCSSLLKREVRRKADGDRHARALRYECDCMIALRSAQSRKRRLHKLHRFSTAFLIKPYSKARSPKKNF
ncbi:hypothetical protein [Scytonema sp. PCC 10023]|uniref:hypothetical protein n=1 Tax=Scytonema sp. PCC 10023 TaxID=1680591 RepID=UPI0039C5E8AD